MKKLTLTIFCFVFSVIAFSQTKIGLQAAYGTNSEFGVGAKASFKITDNIFASPSINYFFGENTQGANSSIIGFNADVHYVFSNNDDVLFYLLAGLNFTRASVSVLGISASTSEIGFNVDGGLNYNLSSSLTGVLEAKYVLSAFDQAVTKLRIG